MPHLPEHSPVHPLLALFTPSGEEPISTLPEAMTLTAAPALASSTPSSQRRCATPSTSQKGLRCSVWVALL